MKEYGKKLVGCIDKLDSVIRTRFFYVGENGEVRDVTLELCEAIHEFNIVTSELRSKGQDFMYIPYKYKYGLAEYSFGCGMSHYLQENTFELIEERYANTGKKLSFPLVECTISMYTPNDVKDILSCESVFDENITESLKERYCAILA